MAHYDCNQCGAGIYEEHSSGCTRGAIKKAQEQAHDSLAHYKSVINSDKAPPIGLRPKSIVDAERIQEIKEAIVRYVLADKEIPKEWQQELYDLRGTTF